MFTLSLDQSRQTRLSCERCGRQMFGLGRSTIGFTHVSLESGLPTRTTSGEEDSPPKINELLETTADTNTAGPRGANPHKTQALQPESPSTSDTDFSRKEKQSQLHAEQQDPSPPDREVHEDRHAHLRTLHREKTLQRQAIGRNCRCMDECLCQRFSVAVEAPETARNSSACSLEGSDPERYSLSDLRRPESPFHAFDLSLKHMGDWIIPNVDSPANTRTGNSNSSLTDLTQITEPTTVDTGVGAEHFKTQGRSKSLSRLEKDPEKPSAFKLSSSGRTVANSDGVGETSSAIAAGTKKLGPGPEHTLDSKDDTNLLEGFGDVAANFEGKAEKRKSIPSLPPRRTESVAAWQSIEAFSTDISALQGQFESRSKDWELRNRRRSSIFRSSSLAPGSAKSDGISQMPSVAEDASPKLTTKIRGTTSSAGELAQKDVGNTTSNIADPRDTQRNDIHPDDDPRLTRMDNKLVRLRWKCVGLPLNDLLPSNADAPSLRPATIDSHSMCSNTTKTQLSSC